MFPMLKIITLVDEHVRNGQIGKILEPFRLCTSLEQLVVQLSHDDAAVEPAPTYLNPTRYERFKPMMESLDHLFLSEAYLPVLLPFCTNLDSLTVWGCARSQSLVYIPKPTSVPSLPRLTTYRVHRHSKIFPSLECPALTEMNDMGYTGPSFGAFLKRSQCALECLEVKHPYSDWASAIPTINASLTTLVLWPTSDIWERHVAQDIVPLLIGTNGDPGIFPNLRSLTVQCMYVLECARWGAFIRAVETRCKRPPKATPRAFLGRVSIVYFTNRGGR